MREEEGRTNVPFEGSRGRHPALFQLNGGGGNVIVLELLGDVLLKLGVVTVLEGGQSEEDHREERESG